MKRSYLLALMACLLGQWQDLHAQTVAVTAQALPSQGQHLEIPPKIWILIGIAVGILWGLAWWVMRKLKW